MKDQVTTSSQSKELLKIGIPATIASCFYINGGIYTNESEYEFTEADIPAFTIIDLLNILPPAIFINRQYGVLKIDRDSCFYWHVYYATINELYNYSTDHIICKSTSSSLISSIVNIIKWLVSHECELFIDDK